MLSTNIPYLCHGLVVMSLRILYSMWAQILTKHDTINHAPGCQQCHQFVGLNVLDCFIWNFIFMKNHKNKILAAMLIIPSRTVITLLVYSGDLGTHDVHSMLKMHIVISCIWCSWLHSFFWQLLELLVQEPPYTIMNEKIINVFFFHFSNTKRVSYLLKMIASIKIRLING